MHPESTMARNDFPPEPSFRPQLIETLVRRVHFLD